MIDQRAVDISFIAFTVYREARAEPYVGKLAVAYSILNRVSRPSWWGNTVLAVIFKRLQYSSVSDPRDPQLEVTPAAGSPLWLECLRAAEAAYDRTEANPVPGADSYYATYIPAPKWADPARFVAQIGGHRFYNLDHDHERTVG